MCRQIFSRIKNLPQNIDDKYLKNVKNYRLYKFGVRLIRSIFVSRRFWSIYIFINILVENGHFCPEKYAEPYFLANNSLSEFANSNQTVLELGSATNSLGSPKSFKFIQICTQQPDSIEKQASIFSLLGLLVVNFGCLFFGFICDRFRPLFIRILIIVLFASGWLILSFINFENELAILSSFISSIIVMNIGAGLLFIDLLSTLPIIFRKFEFSIRTLLLAMPMGSGWFYWFISEKLLGSKTRRRRKKTYI